MKWRSQNEGRDRSLVKRGNVEKEGKGMMEETKQRDDVRRTR